MTPQTGTAILVLAAFVLPGFVTLLIRERTYVIPGQASSFERLLSALYYAAIVYALLLCGGLLIGVDKQEVVDLYRGRASLETLVGIGIVVMVIFPLLVAETGRLWRRSSVRHKVLKMIRVSEAHGIGSGWNKAFSSVGTSFVRVTTNDGRVVGGLFAPGSLAGYSQQAQDLYLVQRWRLDDQDWFVEAVEDSRGLWIPQSNIASIEIYGIATSSEH